MRKLLGAAVAACSVVALAGCDTTSAVAPYTAYTPNVLAFQTALKPSGTTVRVGDFSAADGVSKPECRLAGSLDVAPGSSIQNYVKEALQTELFTAQVYDSNSKTVISGRLDKVKVNTFGTGSWTLGMQVSSTIDPAGYHVEVTRPFNSSFTAVAACRNATNAFAPTVQQLIGEVVKNPEFGRLVGRT